MIIYKVLILFILMPGNRTLYETLKKDKLYTKSYEEFSEQFATPEKLYSLYTLMKADGFYTKTIDEFKTKFFPPQKEVLSIKDTREMDSVTGTPVSDKSRLHANVDPKLIERIAAKAKEHDIDPYTALAIGFQETGLREEYADNPFHLLSGDRLNPETADEDILDLTMLTLKDKNKLAGRLGKKTEEDIIQAWNGYGKIDKTSFGGTVKKIYGIDVSEKPIDMGKNPVYGKRVVDIRDNILKRDPNITQLVEGVSPLKQK